jgi:multidrug efflux system membrane fusion protein
MQTKPITAVFTLPEDFVPKVVARIRSGDALQVDAYDRNQSKKLASGTLEAIDNQVDPTTGTFKLRARFDNEDESLFPNQFVNIRLLLDVDKGATVIPSSAIERGQQGSFVYVIGADKTAQVRNVTLGTIEGENQSVTSGIKAGDEVVVDGADKLSEGMKVIVQGSGRKGPPADASAPGAHLHSTPPPESSSPQ